MRTKILLTACSAIFALSAPALANENSPKPSPKLVVGISIDQFSADLFNEYRSTYKDGLKRLAEGAVFPAGYQSHAATETCPGHSTIMTGSHPARTGIIANSWIDLDAEREDKVIYCSEDEREAGTDSKNYVESAVHLKVPTLGDRIKAVSPKSRNVAVSGKDRGALMMGGHNIDEVYFWKGKQFATLKGRVMLPVVEAINAQLAEKIEKSRGPFAVPDNCAARNHTVAVNAEQSVGTYRFERPENGSSIFRASPDFDAVTGAVAIAVIKDMKLGQGEAVDVLSVSYSATDYVGHAFGTKGTEMCIQMAELDKNIGDLFRALDDTGVDYVIALTADHGGYDLPERLAEQAMPYASRIDPEFSAAGIDKQLKAEWKWDNLDYPLIVSDGPFGDFYVSNKLTEKNRTRVKIAAMERIAKHPQVETVLDGAELAGLPKPQRSVDEWSLKERAAASYNKDVSGDFIVLLKSGVTPIAKPGRGFTATHGSPWNYDRRVPIVFWRKGIIHFEQPLPVETVDIAPTLASLIGLDIPADEIDGRCLDIDADAGDNCKTD